MLMTNFVVIGNRIKGLRKEKKLSQALLAARIRRDQSVISKIERGEIELSPLIALAICNTFGIREEWLLTGKEPKYDDRMKLLKERAKELGEDVYHKYTIMEASHDLRKEAVLAVMEGRADYGSYDELADPELYEIVRKVTKACEDPQKREALKKLLTVLAPDLK
jgi:transcriptional regulator with XRE-family HTH domain